VFLAALERHLGSRYAATCSAAAIRRSPRSSFAESSARCESRSTSSKIAWHEAKRCCPAAVSVVASRERSSSVSPSEVSRPWIAFEIAGWRIPRLRSARVKPRACATS